MRDLEAKRAGVRASLKKRRAFLKGLRRCVDCSKKRVPGHVLCQKCLDDRKRRSARERAGL
jgi:uncharacterized OB-fold protein